MRPQMKNIETKAFDMFLKLFIKTLGTFKNKGYNIELLPPTCAMFYFKDDTFRLIGFDCVYDEEELFSDSLQHPQETHTWILRTKQKFSHDGDFICFGYTTTAIEKGQKEYIFVVLTAIASDDRCFSVVIAVTNDLFNQKQNIEDYSLIVGCNTGMIPYYGSFLDRVH
jgi:hypothetical protein